MPGEDGQPQEQAAGAVDEGLAALKGHAIIAGFGIPGRAVANLLFARGVPYCVLELNPETVGRCLATRRLLIFQGNATDEPSLRRAGIDRAAYIVLAMPVESAVLEGILLARRLNPGIKILARCRHVSTALEALRRGADEVLSEEQVVAERFSQTMQGMLGANAAQAGAPAK